MRFLPILPLLLVGLLAGLLLADTHPLAARSALLPQDISTDDGPTPFWDSINVEDDLPTMLLRVPAGKRFVLTDLWFLPMDHKVLAPTSALDIVWLESQRGSDQRLIFDAPLKYLALPLRWETGVAFEEGREMWLNYRSKEPTDLLRRVHFSGYFEDTGSVSPSR